MFLFRRSFQRFCLSVGFVLNEIKKLISPALIAHSSYEQGVAGRRGSQAMAQQRGFDFLYFTAFLKFSEKGSELFYPKILPKTFTDNMLDIFAKVAPLLARDAVVLDK